LVVFELVEGLDAFEMHLFVEGVQLVGAVDREQGNGAAVF
jgi:hypothetical protein